MSEERASNKIKRCVIITGMSGGGKSSALHIFEDQGFYVIDNLPPTLLPQLLDVLMNHQSAVCCGVAAVVDVRGEELLDDLDNVLPLLRRKTERLEILFVDASDDVLVRRYETTRRRHPLTGNSTILDGLAKEREMLAHIRRDADIVIDTSGMKTTEFRTRLFEVMGMTSNKINVIISSFGFKFGLPQDSDYVLDVRFLPNPNYVDELHPLSGRDQEVRKYLSGFEALETFINRAEELLDFIASVYPGTGKNQLHIAIGCTGGRHRSVAVSEILGNNLKKRGNSVIVKHRDIDKGNYL